ncbi:hypothetical protein DITRI_Ditri06bG0089200 [Diplodiscus trichospermus]
MGMKKVPLDLMLATLGIVVDILISLGVDLDKVCLHLDQVDGWPHMGGQGSSQTFSFSFGGSGGSRSFSSRGGSSSFGFYLNDILSGFFGGGMKDQGAPFGGFGGSSRESAKGSLEEYKGDLIAQNILPRSFTKVHDASDPAVKKLVIDALPAIIGWKHILKSGSSVKDLKSAIKDLSMLLDSFQKRNKKVASSQNSKIQTDSNKRQLPLLIVSNFDALCGDKTLVCIIDAFRSSRDRKKQEPLLYKVRKLLFSKEKICQFVKNNQKRCRRNVVVRGSKLDGPVGFGFCHFESGLFGSI